jgi:uncharacterized protein (DUF58 family)
MLRSTQHDNPLENSLKTFQPVSPKAGAAPLLAGWQGPGARGGVRRFSWNAVLWALVFPQRGHRILPTIAGTLLIALSLGIGMAAYNSANNILFITLSLLLACLILSGVLSWLNFRGVAWRLELAPPLRAGHEAAVGLGLRNGKRFLPTYGLWFELVARHVAEGPPPAPESTITGRGVDVRAAWAQAGLNEAQGRLFLRERLDPQGEAKLDWTFKPGRRGRMRVELESVGCQFPFGFLRKNLTTMLREEVVVWPAPVPYRRVAVAGARRTAGGERLPRPGSGGDLLNLRRYATGDSHRLVHWKASARSRELLVRQFAAESTEGFQFWLRTDAAVWPRPEQFELLASFAATLAEDLFRAGQLAAVALDDEAPLPVRRVRDLELLLDRLAVMQPRGESNIGGVPPPRDGIQRGEGTPPTTFNKRNVLTFAPDGARGVAAYVDGEKTATA